MDANEFKTVAGSCIISEDVIASIAGTAALETEGVAALANRPADIRGIISQNPATRAVRVLNTENDTILDGCPHSGDRRGPAAERQAGGAVHDRQAGDPHQRTR